ncbi:LPS-assembly protein LptD [Thalassocella blandensis]|nr:LPS-assembly protein LptD [Thalassocella blandensis]
MPKSVVKLKYNSPRLNALMLPMLKGALTILCLVWPAAIAWAQTHAGKNAQKHIDPADYEYLERLAEESPFEWIKKEQLPDKYQSLVLPGCTGIYLHSVQPEAREAITSQRMDTQPLVVTAKDATVTGANTAVLEGNVRVSQGDRSISAGRMSYERNVDRAVLEEHVTIKQRGMRIQGEFAEVSTTKNRAVFEDAKFVIQEDHIRGSAESVQQTSASRIELRNGMITSCEPGHEAWSLEGEELSVDSATNQGHGKNVKLKIGSVPVFYLPYISFPVGEERQSGLLFPSISSSDDGGLDITIPYYWNMAPNYDATISPRFITGRGTMLEFETRYLNEWMRSSMGFAILPDDGGSQDEDLDELIERGEITAEEARPYQGSNRWLLDIDQRGGELKGWYTALDFTRVSDVDYLRELGTATLAVTSNTYLNQSFEVGYQFDHWRLSTLAQSQQVLLLDLDTPYRKLPQVDLNGRYRVGGWSLELQNRFTQFSHPDEGQEVLTGQRANTDYRLYWERRETWGFIKPEVGYKTIYYNLEEDSISNIPEEQFGLGTPQASLDFGLIFEHPGGPFTQTFEPRAYYLYRKYESHEDLYGLGVDQDQNINFDTSSRTFTYGQLYRDSRFIGGDRLDDANQITLGATTHWQSNTTGRDLFSVSVGQIFHFDERQISLSGEMLTEDTSDASEFATEFMIHLGERTQLYGNTVYDTSNEKINRGSAGLNFATEDYRSLFNVGYSFLREDVSTGQIRDDGNSRVIDQLDTSFTTPISSQWSMMGKLNYDFIDRQELEAFIGFEYNDCCYRLRFLARRWLDSNIANLSDNADDQYDQGVFFEIHFKGLGGSGAKINSILEDGIFGYRDREANYHR